MVIFGDFGLHVVTLGHHIGTTGRTFRRPFLVPIFRSEKKTQKTSWRGHWGALCGHWGALCGGPAECAEPLGGIRGEIIGRLRPCRRPLSRWNRVLFMNRSLLKAYRGPLPWAYGGGPWGAQGPQGPLGPQGPPGAPFGKPTIPIKSHDEYLNFPFS